MKEEMTRELRHLLVLDENGSNKGLCVGCMAEVTYGVCKNSRYEVVEKLKHDAWLVDRGNELPRFHVFKSSALERR